MLFPRRSHGLAAWRIVIIGCLLAGFGPATGLAAGAERSAPTRPAAPATEYKGAIAIDAESGRVLFEDRADVVAPPASVTKLMTFLVVHDRLAAGKLRLDDPVHVTAEASTTGGSQVYLAEKEIFPVEEMLYALMIASANDAATALAIHIAGSKSAFVALMNERARSLGMSRTTFRSPHGLPPANRRIADGDLTTPRDLALLGVHLLKHTDILTYTSVINREFRPGPKVQKMHNHNNLLGKLAGVDGLKTGFTQGAGSCLAATALRDGRRVVVVMMGSPSSQTRDIKMAELIEESFAALPAGSPRFSPSPSAIATNRADAPKPSAEVPVMSLEPSMPAPVSASPAPTPAPNPAAATPAASTKTDEPRIRFTLPKR